MTITTSKVGIGTTTPSHLLTITRSSSALHGTTSAAVTIVGAGTSSTFAALQIIPGVESTNVAGGTFTAFYVRNDGAILVGTSTLPALLEGTTTVNVNTPSLADGSATVYIRGNLYVTGSISAKLMIATNMSKGAGSFLIPHPDPAKEEGWMLRHCFVESPTRGDNLYRFSVEIQSEGSESIIELPSYWKHLNENPQIWVTAVNQFASGYGYVDETSGKLVIKGEKRGVYNVLLVGTRKDQIAKDFFDAKGVEYVDHEISELLTRHERETEATRLISTHTHSNVTKNFLDPIDDEFGLAICQ